MGGDLTVVSEQGEGSRFTVWLPAPIELGAERQRRDAPAAIVSAPQLLGRATRHDTGLTDLGRLLLEQLNDITARFVDALRADPATFPNVDHLTDVQLRDHLQTCLADIAQSLMILHSATDDPSELMRDATEIQRVVSERHGAQRHRLGWTEAAVARQFQLLRQVTEEIVAARGRDRAGEQARSVLDGLIQQAEQISLRGLRDAVQTSPVTREPV
jgi:hypothetical protein